MSRLFIAALCLVLAPTAQALVNGYDPLNKPSINPSNGQETRVWKLVGKYSYPGGDSASAVQIAPRWVALTDHSDSVDAVFKNGYGESGMTACMSYGLQSDFAICRLSTAINLPQGENFPPLTDFPAIGQAISLQAYGEFGTLFGVGYAGGVVRAAWTSIDGLPYTDGGFSIADALSGRAVGDSPEGVSYFDTSLPHTDTGDSGGGLYWFSPSGTPAQIGTFKRANTLGLTALRSYDSSMIAWIQNEMRKAGDDPAAYRPFNTHAEGAQKTPEMLLAQPLVTPTGITSARISWGSIPASDAPPVQRQLLTLSTQGRVDRTSLLSSQSRSIDINNLSSGGSYIVCLTGRNVVGSGSNVSIQSYLVTAPGCKTFRAGVPPAPVLNYSSTSFSSGVFRLNQSWGAVVFNGISRYVLSHKIYDSVTKQNQLSAVEFSSQETNYTSRINASKGQYVCSTVRAETVAGLSSIDNREACYIVN